MRPDYCPMANEPCQSLCDKPCSAHRLKVATLQPNRGWVGLTYEDMIEVWNKLYKERTDVMPLPTTFAKAIEAKLKQKNG